MVARDRENLDKMVDRALKTAVGNPFSKTLDEAVKALCRALNGRGGAPRKPDLARAGRLATKLGQALFKNPEPNTGRHILRQLYELSTAMQERGRALEHARSLNDLCAGSDDFRLRADGLILLAKACFWADDQRGATAFQRKAVDEVDRARERGETNEQDERRFNRDYTVWAFRHAQNTCRWDEADFAFKQAHRAARLWNDAALISDTLILYAGAKMFQGEWVECERIAGECARTALYVNIGIPTCYPFWIWGRSLVYLGRAELALPILKRAVRIGRSTGDAVGLSEAQCSLAEAFLALGRKDEALKTAAEAEKIAAGAALDINLAQIRLWRAWIEIEADPGLAARHIEALHLSLARFERCGTLSGWATALHALGHALVLTGAEETAETYLNMALNCFHEWNMPWHESRTVNSLLLAAERKAT